MTASAATPSGKLASQKQGRLVTKIISYALLVFFSLIMILPLLWLLNGSLQPTWQISANPVIWIPREWLTVNAGDTNRSLNKYLLKAPSGEQVEVIPVGVRAYTTVVDASRLTSFVSVPRDQLTDAVPTLVGEIKLNERTWKKEDGTTEQVVAMARDQKDDANLLVVPADQLRDALFQYPLDVVNRSKSGKVEVSGVNLTTKEMVDGRQVVAIGPEDTFWVMSTPDIAAKGQMVPAEWLGDKDFQTFGRTQLAVYPVKGQPEDQRFIVLTQEPWQPLLPFDVVQQNAFLVKTSQLSEEFTTRAFNDINMIVRTLTDSSGSSREVVVLTTNPNESLVIPPQNLNQLNAAPMTGLVEPGSAEIGTLTYRVKYDFENPDKSFTPMAFVGDLQEFAVTVPASSITTAYDTRPGDLKRSTRVHFYLDGYRKVLNLKLQGVPFWRFFLNSLYLVMMNTIGFFLSCVLVAYGFARIRAPGKEIIFVVLLGTMMIPYTILTLPTFMLFHSLDMLDTMRPLWIRSFFGNAFLIFLLRQFFMSIPYELDEAAYLDGANRLQILLKVIVPLSKPALATVAIFTFWWTWNSFLDPLIFTTRQEYYTITLALNSFNRLYGAGTSGYYDRVLSGAVLALLPMVMLFIFAQRYFIEGIQMQGLKR